MLYLLQLREGTDVCSLPVAERTAACLERVLLATDLKGQRSVLATAIASDPSLALWAVRTANERQRPALLTATATAESLVEYLLVRLSRHGVRFRGSGIPGMAGPAAAGLSTQQGTVAVVRRLDSWDAARFARDLAEIVRRSRAAGTATGGCPEVENSPAYFAAMIDAASAFLQSCPRQADTTTRLLPGFAPVAPPHPRAVGQSASWPDELASFFLEEVPDIPWRLPALVDKLLTKQRELEDFSGRLEREKLAALKELAYGASHEINNPLANIAARAQTLLKDELDPERKRRLTAIHNQAMRAHEMIADLMLFARPPELILERCCLRRVVEQVVSELTDEAQRYQIDLTFHCHDDDVEVRADVTQLCVAIKAVITNALEAVGTSGHVDVHASKRMDNGHSWGVVVVRDDGPGIPDHARRHIFDPFYSGREAGRGLGFGLSKCWRIITDHGGWIRVGQPEGRGAEFVIAVPLWNA